MNFNPAILRSNLMHAKIMEWTNDDALELIEQYRSHTELWNRADPKYKDKLCRFRAWSEIAERFGCSKAEVERKMNVLLTQYRREKHKMLVKLYQGIQPNPSKWYAFKRFDFMEAGGGSSVGSISGSNNAHGVSVGSSSSSSGGIAIINNCGSSNSNCGSTPHNSSITTNGHHNAAAVAAAAALNGLAAASYESPSAAAASTVPTTSHHRRMKSKEMKYFGAMGLNLPMLLANSQPLDTWNPVGQFSPPPISERNQLRVPLPMPFSASQSDLNTSGTGGSRSLFGGSSNSDFSESPQKPMDTTDVENDDNKPEQLDTKCERTTPIPSNIQDPTASAAVTDSRISIAANGSNVEAANGNCVGGDGSGRLSSRSGVPGTEASSSPIPNTNTHEAHKQRHLIAGTAIASGSRDPHDELDIKQELLVDYFHAPHPPAPPDSHRSYSSADDNRHCNEATDEFAQDLRISAAAAAAAKGIDFSRFVLPPGMRRSTESIDEKFSPLNMRKLNTVSTASSAGHMLMNSLLTNDSMSEDNTTSLSGRRKSGSLGNGAVGLGSASQEASSSAAAAAAAAAFYAESLNKDDCDFVGSNVSVKLRSMDRTQRIIAEKLISEVLFYGQFNELERSARIQPK
ncbi:uncharacterized protein ACN2A1_003624 isoform 1-T3 [Glossina fuscipes fuscipes]